MDVVSAEWMGAFLYFFWNPSVCLSLLEPAFVVHPSLVLRKRWWVTSPEEEVAGDPAFWAGDNRRHMMCLCICDLPRCYRSWLGGRLLSSLHVQLSHILMMAHAVSISLLMMEEVNIWKFICSAYQDNWILFSSLGYWFIIVKCSKIMWKTLFYMSISYTGIVKSESIQWAEYGVTATEKLHFL